MTIEFHCRHCDKTLRTADDKAGWQAKCPGCGQLISVPDPKNVTPDSVDQSNQTGNQASAENVTSPISDDDSGTRPCPVCGEQIQAAAIRCRFCGENIAPTGRGRRSSGRAREVRPFPPGEVMSEALRIYSERWGLLTGAAAIMVLLNSLSSTSLIPLFVFPELFFHGNNDVKLLVSIIAAALQFALFLLVFAVGVFLQTGYLILTLKVVRQQPATLGDLFSGGRFWFRMLINSIVYYLLVALGIPFCLVPGFIIAAVFLPFGCVLIDEDRPEFDSLWRAKELTDGNWGSMFLVLIVGFACYSMGWAFFCIPYVGLLVAMPYVSVLNVLAYERMTYQTSIKSMLDRKDFI